MAKILKGQLRLDLFVGIPWDGQDPRVLTKGRKVLYLKREQGRECAVADLRQYEMFASVLAPQVKKAPVGAPLLSPLPWER